MALHCFLLQLLFALVVIASFVSDRQMGTHICIRSQLQLGPQLQCSILPVHPSPVTQHDFSHVYIIASTENPRQQYIKPWLTEKSILATVRISLLQTLAMWVTVNLKTGIRKVWMAEKQPPQWFWKHHWDLYLPLVARQSKEQIFREVKDPNVLKLRWSVLVNTYISPFPRYLGNAQTSQLPRARELEFILSNPSVLSQFFKLRPISTFPKFPDTVWDQAWARDHFHKGICMWPTCFGSWKK